MEKDLIPIVCKNRMAQAQSWLFPMYSSLLPDQYEQNSLDIHSSGQPKNNSPQPKIK